MPKWHTAATALCSRLLHRRCTTSQTHSPRVYFLLDTPADVRYRAEQMAVQWDGLIPWHSDGITGGVHFNGAIDG